MTTVSVPVYELTGLALDWAVARCEGRLVADYDLVSIFLCQRSKGSWNYSSNWSQGGPIIEREGIGLDFSPADSDEEEEHSWAAYDRSHAEREYGPTPLIAAMRCYVASKLGPVVDIPAELVAQ